MKRTIKKKLLLLSLPFLLVLVGLTFFLLLFTSSDDTPIAAANVTDPQTQTAQSIWNAVLKVGGTEQGAAALLGNWKVESSLQASSIQNQAAYNETKAMDPSTTGYAFGLAQLDGKRRVALIKYAASQKMAWTDVSLQIAFVFSQEGSNSSLIKQLIKETNVNQATEDIMRQWERAGATKSLATRQADVAYWYQTLTSGTDTSGVQASLPAGWSLDKPIDDSHYSTATYAFKQCTWFVWNRARDFGITYSPYMGNGADWQQDAGYSVTTTPTLHSAVSFSPGQSVGGIWNASAHYGHVVFVEAIHPDGSVFISESGTSAATDYYFQVLTKAQASQYHYVIGK